MDIVKRFAKLLDSVEYPKSQASWNIAGVLKGTNGFYKFDVRDMFNLPDGSLAQEGKVDTQADKMVFDIKDQWVIVDLDELHQHLKQKNLKKVYLEDLISQLDWNIILPKN